MLKISHASLCILSVMMLNLSACSPQLDWREVRSANPAFVVVLPAKPATFSRTVNLDGQQVMMTMTAAEVDHVTYAVGTAALPDAEKARNALDSMRIALVKNIGGVIKLEKRTDDKTAQTTSLEIEALGPPSADSGGQAIKLFARFVAKDKQVYQVLILGRANVISGDAVDTFFTSFKLN